MVTRPATLSHVPRRRSYDRLRLRPVFLLFFGCARAVLNPLGCVELDTSPVVRKHLCFSNMFPRFSQ